MNPHRYDVSPSKAAPATGDVATLETLLARERETNEALKESVAYHSSRAADFAKHNLRLADENAALRAQLAAKAAPAPDTAQKMAFHLSPRELDVVRLLAKGLLYKEIAEVLGITFSTTHTYIKRAYERMGVQSRTQCVVKFLNANRP